MTAATLRVVVCIAAAALGGGGCSKGSDRPATTPPAKVEPVDPSPPLSAEDQAALEADFAEAQKNAEEASALKKQALEMQRAKNNAGAREAYTVAAQKYGKACEKVMRWVKAESGKVTELQLQHRLKKYHDAYDAWLTDSASISGQLQVIPR